MHTHLAARAASTADACPPARRNLSAKKAPTVSQAIGLHEQFWHKATAEIMPFEDAVSKERDEYSSDEIIQSNAVDAVEPATLEVRET